MLDKKYVCAGIVTFNPVEELITKCLKAILPQVDKIYIFDNGSCNRAFLDTLKEYNENIEIESNSSNIGIASALNYLCKSAKQDGYQWIITMDQDSICEESMVEHLREYADKGNYGIVAPRVEFWNDERLLTSTKYPEKQTYEIQACITSGSLTKIEAWIRVGGFDEWMFIDHVDNEFCVHLKDEGYSIIRVNAALLYQRAGEMKYRMMKDGSSMLLPYYSPKRQFFICRNTVYYLRKYRKSKNVRLLHEWGVLFYTIYLKLRYEKNRWSTLCSSLKGIFAGITKRIEHINYVTMDNNLKKN